MDYNIVAVTACVSGVAHTYMAAERLEKVGHHEKWNIKIETQGALGVENKITADDIAHADVVLLVTDIEIDDARRFNGIRTIKTSIKTFLLQPQQIVEAVKCIMKKPVVYIEIP
ncbi:TPA: PTS fructose-like transporter subunit IIB [Klebsiella oxytoca]|nr:PTS fructose-like transporter subunit IIB [Klebsiella oxytoca]